MTQSQTIRLELEKELYKRDFFSFVCAAVQVIEPQTVFSFNWHIKYLCDFAQELVESTAQGIQHEHRNTIINVPPRSMKSLVFSVCLNAWAWTRFPHLKFMTLSYADNLSAKFAYKTRLLIKSDWYHNHFGDVYQLSDDDNRKTAYSNNKTGTRESFGMAGSVTGSGADIIICDDLNKPSDVSDTKLDNVITVYRDTIENRTNTMAATRLLIAQRTNERDITGHLLSSDDTYHHICLPAELTTDIKPQYLSAQYVNNLLWKDRMSVDWLHQYDKNTWMYSSQYLQSPTNIDGLIKRKWFPVIRKESISDLDFANLKWEMYLDTAYTSNEKQDETGCIIGAKWGNTVLIKKVFIWYLEFPQLVSKIKEVHDAYMRPNEIIRIEPKANGLSLIQYLKHNTTMNIIKTETPKDSKIQRVSTITGYWEAEKLQFLQDSSYDIALQQLCAFPHSNKDGIVDCCYYITSQFLTKNSGMKYIRG